jgi:hypothetical protein
MKVHCLDCSLIQAKDSTRTCLYNPTFAVTFSDVYSILTATLLQVDSAMDLDVQRGRSLCQASYLSEPFIC